MLQTRPEFSLTSEDLISAASDIAARYALASLEPLVTSCRTLAARDEIGVAVVGRFKAGKSSFLNHYLEHDLLPVGVVPVTTVVTEISYGPVERATVHFSDERVEEVPLEAVREFVAESANPGNRKHVDRVSIELPSLKELRGLRFVDMPGLESVLEHNTETAMRWLPNVGLALVAISVDPPLTQADLTLLKTIYQYTPNVSVLLTKADLLTHAELDEVIGFVREKLSGVFETKPPIFPYSVRDGYAELKARLESELIRATVEDFKQHHFEILQHKLANLLRECGDYLALALASAETVESERCTLRQQLLGEGAELSDVKAEMRLIVSSAKGATRVAVESVLARHRGEIERRLLEELSNEYPTWTRSLKAALSSFENWLTFELSERLMAISQNERSGLVAPLDQVKRQVFRVLQGFRDQLSERALRVFGVPLRTTEVEIGIQEPRSPDIRIGRVFDHNWELLSAIAPMSLLKGVVYRHFRGQVPYMVEKNLSRLTSQWEESLKAAMGDLHTEAERRLNNLAETVGRLLSTSGNSAPDIRSDVQSIEAFRTRLSEAASLDIVP